MSFHDFNGLLLNLRAGNVDGLFKDTIGNSPCRNKLDYLPSFFANLWNWHVKRFLSCVLFEMLLKGDLRDLDTVFPNLRNENVDESLNNAF